jgi:hypothetical protein
VIYQEGHEWHVETVVTCQGQSIRFVSPKIDHAPAAGEVLGIVTCCQCGLSCTLTSATVEHHEAG